MTGRRKCILFSNYLAPGNARVEVYRISGFGKELVIARYVRSKTVLVENVRQHGRRAMITKLRKFL